jgi:hypothetical protein
MYYVVTHYRQIRGVYNDLNVAEDVAQAYADLLERDNKEATIHLLITEWAGPVEGNVHHVYGRKDTNTMTYREKMRSYLGEQI